MKVPIMSFWPSRFFYIEYRICGASSWHKSKLAFVNVRALALTPPPHPSIYHLLVYFECVC